MSQLITLRNETSNPEYGKPPEKRDMRELLQSGVVCIDKPVGPTSHQAADFVKNILKVEKAGHAGTLDPHVSGLLVVGINNGTKILKAQLEAPKEYVCLMYVHKAPKDSEVKEILKEFTGPLLQRPPIRAAVLRVLRVREIYENKFLEHEGKNVLFKVSCEAGTYIRRLCHDMGLALGSGAHMKQLRRVKSGAFDESSITTLHDLADAYAYWAEDALLGTASLLAGSETKFRLISRSARDSDEKPLRKIIQPLENALSHLPRVIISDFAVDSLAHGAQLAIPGVLQLSKEIKAGDLVGVFTQKGEGVMLATALMSSEEIAEKEKGFAFKTERILIKQGIYPKFKKLDKKQS